MAASVDSLEDSLVSLLDGVHPDWLALFEEKSLMSAARQALKKVEKDADSLSPSKALIFESFRYFSPDDVKVVIIGQDPYPDSAQGICFSIPSRMSLKQSLRPIITNLEEHDLARMHYKTKNDTDSGVIRSGDLRSWSVQGVLMLNAALTNKIGDIGAHRGHWSAFTRGLISALSERAAASDRQLIFMLWGGDARAFVTQAQKSGQHHIYQWSHPSPMSNNRLPKASKFERAPHFKDANGELATANLRPIQWDPLDFTLAFTDGSCLKNGASNAEAGFAAIILTGPLKKTTIRGKVLPYEYALVDKDDLLKGFSPKSGAGEVVPTNNRGEYLAWCWILLLLLRGCTCGRIEIVSDCNLFIQTMKEWLPSRRRKGTAEDLKNYDLILIAETLLKALRKDSIGVELTHVNSHQKKPGADTSAREQVLWHGNDQADKEAAMSITDSDEITLEADQEMRWRLLEAHHP